MPTLASFPSPSNEEIRSIREFSEEIEDGESDVLVFNNDVYYPLINIDPKSIIKPSIVDIKTTDVFLEDNDSFFKKAYHKWGNEGAYSALEILSSISLEKNENTVFNYFVKNIAYYILYIWNAILILYTYLYPYALLSKDELYKEFCKYNHKDGVIKCISWHPVEHKIALALRNDNVYIYSSDLLTPLLKHPLQKKITDMAWNPSKSNFLAIACFNVILVWNIECKDKNIRLPTSCATIIKDELSTPLICIEFDQTGNWLTTSSPSSSKLYFLNQSQKPNPKQVNLNETKKDTKNENKITLSKQIDDKPCFLDKKVKIFGGTITQFTYSSDFSRMCMLTTQFGIRVYETNNWTYKSWGKELKSVGQCACWSEQNGRILLFSVKSIPTIFAVLFYDKAEANYVGGTNSCVPVLDVKESELNCGVKVGGTIQNMIWDQNSERLALLFKNNPRYIAIYKTKIKPSLEISPIGFVHGLPSEIALCMTFHKAFNNGSLLTVCWDSGYVSHIPLQYVSNVKQTDDTKMTSCARSLTSFCMPSSTNETSFGWASPDSNYLNITKRYITQDSIISPRRPVLFSSFSEEK